MFSYLTSVEYIHFTITLTLCLFINFIKLIKVTGKLQTSRTKLPLCLQFTALTLHISQKN